MKLRTLTLIVAMYVSMDLANPLLPGALMFGVDDSVEARQTDRFRGHDEASQLPLAPTFDLVVPAAPSAIRSRVGAPMRSHVRQDRVTRSDPSPRTSPPSPEDH